MITKKQVFIILILLVICLAMIPQKTFASSSGIGNFIIEWSGSGALIIRNRENVTTGTEQLRLTSRFDPILERYGQTLTWISGIATIILVIVFVVLCVKCAFYSTDHWILKRQVMLGLLWVGIATAIMGSMTAFLVLFQFMFRM